MSAGTDEFELLEDAEEEIFEEEVEEEEEEVQEVAAPAGSGPVYTRGPGGKLVLEDSD